MDRTILIVFFGATAFGFLALSGDLADGRRRAAAEVRPALAQRAPTAAPAGAPSGPDAQAVAPGPWCGRGLAVRYAGDAFGPPASKTHEPCAVSERLR